MSVCQLGMHKSIQDHINVNVCKQTYAASCNLLCKNVVFAWSADCQKAFDGRKMALASAPVLVVPDCTKPV